MVESVPGAGDDHHPRGGHRATSVGIEEAENSESRGDHSRQNSIAPQEASVEQVVRTCAVHHQSIKRDQAAEHAAGVGRDASDHVQGYSETFRRPLSHGTEKLLELFFRVVQDVRALRGGRVPSVFSIAQE